MKKRQGSVLIIVLAVLAMALVAGLAYYALTSKPSSQVVTSTTSQASTSVGVDSTGTKLTKTNLSLVMPVGWKEVAVAEPYPGDENIRIESEKGDWMQIDINPGGRGFSVDVVWEYTYNADGTIRLVKEQPDQTCDENVGEWPCAVGDGKFDLYVSLPGEYKGKWASTFAGNTTNEKADREVFRQILQSIQFQ